ncbi:inhibitor of nuclear factor kappa-B kinase-interacting protein isoform X2 [Pimephales promelas]|uniref:inhibitor of nuclear factor kappa-B kinase-interacting protein isoform X2 n=1 Tax=Pimephales promelas TaxID=90988 RepID=UPI0019558D51|nr:inhibitor of nuclear factor kappa-B kinase-interacting protein isoform X2 [Pimephales promelas]
MQISDIKHRQKSSNKQQNGEKRRSEDEKKKESVIRDSFSPDEKKKDSFSAAEKKESVIIRESFRPDVKFCVSLMCLALSVIVAWLHIQQSATLAEMRGKYEYLQEKSRSVEELDEKLTEVSQQLQASADAATLLSKLRLSLGSVLNTSAALREHQDSASRRLHTHTQQSAELRALHTHSRGAHTEVAAQVNTLEERLRGLEERLQEVQDGVRGNTRALERTEEEELQRVRELAERSDSSVSRLQERLERLAAQARGLQERLRQEEEAGRAQQDEEVALEEAVRSMLRVRALVSATRRRFQELEEQVKSAEERRTRRHHPTPQANTGES